MKIVDFVTSLFKKDYCEKCGKRITFSDRKKGGIGGTINGSNSKTFYYCIKCSKKIFIEMLNGKKVKLP